MSLSDSGLQNNCHSLQESSIENKGVKKPPEFKRSRYRSKVTRACPLSDDRCTQNRFQTVLISSMTMDLSSIERLPRRVACTNRLFVTVYIGPRFPLDWALCFLLSSIMVGPVLLQKSGLGRDSGRCWRPCAFRLSSGSR